MTTGTQLQRGRRGAQGGYINDDEDTWNVRLAITINKAQGQTWCHYKMTLQTGTPGHI